MNCPVEHGQAARPAPETGRAVSPRVTVVIVSYRSQDTIGITLDNLQDAHEARLVDVVVVDNASGDGTADFIAARWPWVTLKRSDINLGFGKGCNEGFKHANTPYVLLVNPDAVVRTDALTSLVDFMETNPRAGIAGPAVKEPSGALQSAGGLPTPWTIMLQPVSPKWAGRGNRLVQPGEAATRTDWICGCVMLLRKKMIDEIGGFDRRFFLYFEETDLCYRAQQAGWEIWTVGASVCEHLSAASTRASGEKMFGDNIAKHYFQSRLYYLCKHFGWPKAFIAELGELAFMIVRAIGDAARGRKPLGLLSRLRGPILKLPARVTGDRMQGRRCVST